MEGLTSAILVPSKTGQYRVSGKTGCGITKASDPFVLKTCLSMEYLDDTLVHEDAGDLKLTFRLGLASEDDVNFWYRTVPQNGASEGLDYEALTGVGTIPAGATETELYLTILEDDIYESQQEGFLFEVYDAENATVQNPELYISIEDNDTLPVVTLIDHLYVTEGEGVARVGVKKTGKTDQLVSVDYYTRDGSDTFAGEHYEETKGTLVFQPGEEYKVIEVPLIDNDVLNNRRVVYFWLENEVNTRLDKGGIKIFIYDDDEASARLNFMPTGMENVEEGDSLWLNLQLTEPVALDVTFDISPVYETTDAADIVVVDNPLRCIIEAGKTEFNCTYATVDDKIPEEDEVISFNFSNLENAIPGQISTTYVIKNNDYIPQLLSDNFHCKEDKEVFANVMDNDVIKGDYPLTLTFFPPNIGTFGETDGGLGAFGYVPPANYSGAVNFSYQVKDASGDSALANVQIVVEPVNDVPIAYSDTVYTDEDTPCRIFPLANDIDVDMSGLVIESVFDNSLGTVTNTNTYIDYQPYLNANGLDVLTYQIQDNEGDPSYAKIYVNIRAVNDVPLAKDDSYTIYEDSPETTLDVLQNDEDQDRSGISITQISGFIGGRFVLENNKIEFLADANFWGDARVNYQIADGEGDTAFATATIEVLPANDFPVAHPDAYTMDEDGSFGLSPLDNDEDDDQRGLTMVAYDQPLHGSFIIGASPLVYVPDADFCGVDSFRYYIEDWNRDADFSWVKVTVNCVNEAPRAWPDTFVLTEDDGLTSLDVLFNDEDADASGLSLSELFNVSGGGALLRNQKIDFTPSPDFYGNAQFSYVLQDGEGDRDTAQVVVQVNAVNDVPVAMDDNLWLYEDSALLFNVLDNDDDKDKNGLLIDTVWMPYHGVLQQNDTMFTYQPAPDYCGMDSFRYIIADAQGDRATAMVRLQINCVNEDPLAQPDSVFATEDVSTKIYPIVNDLDPDGGGISIKQITHPENGTLIPDGDAYIYRSDNDYNGWDSVTYTIVDAEGDESNAKVIIKVIAVNDYPVAQNDVLNVNEDTEIIIHPLLNDVDVEDGRPLSFLVYQEPKMGEYQVVGDQIKYMPDRNLWGNDTMAYVARDAFGAASEVAYIYITIDSVNEDPVLIDLYGSLMEDDADTINALELAFDPDFSGLTLHAVSEASSGLTRIWGNDVIYQPHENYFGTDTLTYYVMDGEGDVSAAQIFYNVTPVNDVPVADNDWIGTIEDVPVAFYPTQSDADVEDLMMSRVVIVSEPRQGNYSVEGIKVTYLPYENLWGEDTIIYVTYDSQGAASNQAYIYMTIDSVNEAPIIQDVHVNINEDTSDTIDVLFMAESPDFSPLKLLEIEQCINCPPDYTYMPRYGGSRVMDNKIVYHPNINYYGKDSMYFKVQDGEGDISEALLTIDILPVNDAPLAQNDFYTNVIGGIKDSAMIHLPVTENDTDVDEQPLQGSLVIDSLPRHGTISYATDNMTLIYMPDDAFVGYDSLSYRLQDTLSAASNQAWVTIFTDSFNYVPRAVNDTVTGDEDQYVDFNPMLNDWDIHGDSLWPVVNHLAPTDGPFDVMLTEHGFVELHNDTLWRYYPQTDFYGRDSGYYEVHDVKGGRSIARLHFYVAPVNDVPTLSVQSGDVSYEENSAWHKALNNFDLNDVDSDSLWRADIKIVAAQRGNSRIKVDPLPWMQIVTDSSLTAYHLKLSGKHTAGQWRQAINSLAYINHEDNDTLTRQLNIVLWDTPLSHSDTLYSTLKMLPVNDVPVNLSRPYITGTYLPDSVLRCEPGSWYDAEAEVDFCFNWAYSRGGRVFSVLSDCADSLVISGDMANADRLWCTVRATDRGYPLPAASAIALSDTLAPANYTPRGLTLSQDTLYRSAVAGSFIATLQAQDPDTAQSHSYSLVSGGEYLRIEDDSLFLDTAAFFMDASQYKFRVRVQDDGPAQLSASFELSLLMILDLMPAMAETYPLLLEVYGDSAVVAVKADKPGWVTYDVMLLGNEDWLPPHGLALEYDNKLAIKANEELLISIDSLSSETDYTFIASLVDTSGGYFSDVSFFDFRTLDVTGPELVWPAPYIHSAGLDSAVLAVQLDEIGVLHYSVYENDTLYFVDSMCVDSSHIGTDSLLLDDAFSTSYITLDSLCSQMRYEVTFVAVDTLGNVGEESRLSFTTNDTLRPAFMAQELDINASVINYQVCLTEGGQLLARLRDNYHGLSDFTTPDPMNLYDERTAVRENSVTSIKTEKLPLKGIYLLDMVLVDSAGNWSDMRTLSFQYPEPFVMELASEVIFQGEDVRFKQLNETVNYYIYNINGELMRAGVVGGQGETIPMDFAQDGLYFIRFSSIWDEEVHRVMKVSFPRP